MILKNQIITNIKIESVNDLYKLKPFLEDGTLKINKSQIARELEVDRRTVDKYINGYTKPETRNCDDCITPFYDIIAELLSDKSQQIFYYRKVLWLWSFISIFYIFLRFSRSAVHIPRPRPTVPFFSLTFLQAAVIVIITITEKPA